MRTRTLSLSATVIINLLLAAALHCSWSNAAQPLPTADDLPAAEFGVVPFSAPAKKAHGKERVGLVKRDSQGKHRKTIYRSEPQGESEATELPTAHRLVETSKRAPASVVTETMTPKESAVSYPSIEPKATSADDETVIPMKPMKPKRAPAASGRATVKASPSEARPAPHPHPRKTKPEAVASHRVSEETRSLSELAVYLYGSARLFPKIAAWNGIEAPYRIRIGQKLRLMEPPALTPDQGGAKLQAMRDRLLAKASKTQGERKMAATRSTRNTLGSASAEKSTAKSRSGRSVKASSSSTYQFVVSEDIRNLGDIATYLYGHASHFSRIAAWNGIKAPYRIHPGQRLTLKEHPTLTTREGHELLLALWRKRFEKRELAELGRRPERVEVATDPVPSPARTLSSPSKPRWKLRDDLDLTH